MKHYIFKYKVESIPYYYEFKCYAESEQDAEETFKQETAVYNVSDHYIVLVED